MSTCNCLCWADFHIGTWVTRCIWRDLPTVYNGERCRNRDWKENERLFGGCGMADAIENYNRHMHRMNDDCSCNMKIKCENWRIKMTMFFWIRYEWSRWDEMKLRSTKKVLAPFFYQCTMHETLHYVLYWFFNLNYVVLTW